MTTATGLYTLNSHPQQTLDNTNQFSNSSIGSCFSLHYQQDHRSSDVAFENNSSPSHSLIHLIQSSSCGSPHNVNNENQFSHHINVEASGSITTDDENKLRQVSSINCDALDNDYKPNFSSEPLHLISGTRVHIATALTKPTDRLALSSIINTDEVKPYIHAGISNFSPDPTLDEDAPHEEDDGGTENESTYISLPVTTEDTHPDSSIDSSLQSRHDSTSSTLFHSSWTPPQPPGSQAENQSVMPPPSRPASQSKRKRVSADRSHSTKASASSESTRPKQPPRIKTAEQLATEALIEKQNPHASKNELRSLKLRALHAVRIAERELNMPEAEKQRRLRLREYVRQKRAEERSQKNSSSKQASSGCQPNAVPVGHSTFSSTKSCDDMPNNAPCNGKKSCSQDVKTAIQIENGVHHANPQPVTPNQFTAFPPSGSSLQSASSPQTSILPLNNVCLSEPAPLVNQTTPEPLQRPSKIKASKNEPKSLQKKSNSRSRGSVASLEAEIRKQNPNASPNELKSLKLRALHADRIAEREQNMSEKEKLRRHKLREYMRRRRDEERAEKGNDLTEFNTPIDVCPKSDPHSNYPGSFDCGMNIENQLHMNDGSICGLGLPHLGTDKTDPKEQLAAFSMIQMTHNYHDQYQQSHQAQLHSHLQINPIFNMPMTQPSLDVNYDCSMQTTYGMSDQWSQMPAADPSTAVDEVTQKALHAAIQEAVYMDPYHCLPHNTDDQHQEHYSTNGEHTAVNRLAEMNQGNDMSAIIKARELAMIAAAAAEVEHAQQMQSSTSSHLH